MGIPVPDATCAVAPRVERLFEEMLSARAQSRALLVRAKRAVEIAIEESESAALDLLKESSTMPNLKDNLKQWRDSARIDWFSQFIKAWIPFNAWMTDTFGDLNDRDLLDQVKNGGNVIYNRIVPILTWSQAQAKGAQGGWQDQSQESEEFRLRIEQLNRLLQSCVVEGRRGRVSFETVDLGHNIHIDEQLTKWTRNFRVRLLPRKRAGHT